MDHFQDNHLSVTVVTVCLNSAATIEETIKSVISQDYPLHYFVFDGGSTDGTLEILTRYRDSIDRLTSEPDGGIFNAMNEALPYIGDDLVIFLNSDDVFMGPETVGRLARAAEEHPQAMIVYGDYIHRTERGDRYRRQASRLSLFSLRHSICHQSMAVRREAFDIVGGFEEALVYCADWDWLLRAVVHHRLPQTYIPVPICVFSAGGNSSQWQGLKKDVNIIHSRYFPFWSLLPLSAVLAAALSPLLGAARAWELVTAILAVIMLALLLHLGSFNLAGVMLANQWRLLNPGNPRHRTSGAVRQ